MSRKSLPKLAAALALGLAFPAFAADITVTDTYARASAGAAQVGAAFMTIGNSGTTADSLVAASTPAAAETELHTHMMEGDMMRMRQIPSIDVPAGGTVALQPGGLHVMLMGLKAPLKEGETFPLTLKFAKAGDLTVQVPVKSVAEMAPMMHGAH